MEPVPSLFSASFLTHLEDLITLHHSIYPHIPPQGIFFESLVAQAFRKSNWPTAQVILSKANTPQHDLLVGASKIWLRLKPAWGHGHDKHHQAMHNRNGHVGLPSLDRTHAGASRSL